MSSNVKSAARALQILELFELLQRPAGMMEIAVELGYPASSTSALIQTLCQLGYLNRDPVTQQFAPTLRLPLLGGWIRAGNADGAALSRLVAETRQATGLSAVLSMRHGIHVQYVYVDRAPPAGFTSHRPNAGDLRPIYESAPGLIMLADESDERIGLIARTAAALGKRRVSISSLLQKVDASRKAGYAWDAGTFSPDIGDVAVRIPVDDVFGKSLALSVGASARRVREDHVAISRILQRQIRTFNTLIDPQHV